MLNVNMHMMIIIV